MGEFMWSPIRVRGSTDDTAHHLPLLKQHCNPRKPKLVTFAGNGFKRVGNPHFRAADCYANTCRAEIKAQ